MSRTPTQLVAKVVHLAPAPVGDGHIQIGFRLENGGIAKYALSPDAAEQMFHFLTARFSPLTNKRPRHLHEATDAHVDRVESPQAFLLHFETTDYADQTIRVSEPVLRRLHDQVDRALALESHTSGDAES
jgi:hypothetical protein